METHTFLMPDYYPQFSCKMGACRAACCVGWRISISMQDYFKLLGLKCDADLRHRLDCCLRMLDHPTADEYACFEPRYDGNCAARMPDGRCSIQANLGEELLPDVCRLYPRGIRADGNGSYECSCANSCEAVIELLYERSAPIAFIEKDLCVQLPRMCERHTFFETLGKEREIRLHLISIVQDRRIPLSKRLMRLHRVICDIETVLERKDRSGLSGLLNERREEGTTVAQTVETSHLQFGLEIARQMLAILNGRSESVRECGETALRYFSSEEDTLSLYRVARSRFSDLFPNWEVFFEHLLVNHMFFSTFPFQDRPECLRDESVALCAVYALMRFLCLGTVHRMQTPQDLADLSAAAFRLIDHTEFDRLSSRLLRRLQCTSDEQLEDLVCL